MFWSVEPLYAEDIESLAKRFQDIGSFSPSEAAAIGAARCGWEREFNRGITALEMAFLMMFVLNGDSLRCTGESHVSESCSLLGLQQGQCSLPLMMPFIALGASPANHLRWQCL